jgi:hypothetical protein
MWTELVMYTYCRLHMTRLEESDTKYNIVVEYAEYIASCNRTGFTLSVCLYTSSTIVQAVRKP